jgi:hypothetical protein
MSKTEILLLIAAISSTIVTLKLYWDQNHIKKSKKHICIYNECVLCYERPCGECSIKNECQRCCGEECRKCGGYTEVEE